jgi:hypothetical protein
MGLFYRNFIKLLKESRRANKDFILQEEDRFTFITDKLGKQVEVPYGGT